MIKMNKIRLIEKEVNRNKNRIIGLIQKLVKIPSFSGDKKGLSEIAQILSDEMNKIGLSVEFIEAEKGLPNVVGRFNSTDSSSPWILFNGHTDVVPVQNEEKWIVDPFKAEIKDGKMYGRGACDMKGGLGAMVAASRIVLDLFPEYNGNFVLTGTVDEEIGGAIGMQYILKKGVRANMGIVCEPSDLMITNVCKGLVWTKLKTIGKSAHGSMPENGINAVYKMSKILHVLEGYTFDRPPHEMLGSPTINVGTVRGGSKPNLIPDLCEVELDIRYLPDQTYKEVMNDLERIINELKEEDPEIKTEMDMIRYRSSVEVQKHEKIIQTIVDATKKVKDAHPGFKGMPSPGDSEHLVKAGIPSVMFGPGSEDLCHVDNEWIAVNEILTAVKIYAAIMLEGEKNGK